MLKKSRPQKGDYNEESVTAKRFKNLILVEKSHYIRFFRIYKPFCYEQTSPLGRRNQRCIVRSKFQFAVHSLRCFSFFPKTFGFRDALLYTSSGVA